MLRLSQCCPLTSKSTNILSLELFSLLNVLDLSLLTFERDDCVRLQQQIILFYIFEYSLIIMVNDSKLTIPNMADVSKYLERANRESINIYVYCLIKQCLWAQCCFVYSVTGETAIFKAPKVAPSGKKWICIFIQTNAKIKFSHVCTRNKWAVNMLMFYVDVNMKRLGIPFKND